MKILFWVITTILILAWVIGYLIYGVLLGGVIQILLLLVLVITILRLVADKKPPEEN